MSAVFIGIYRFFEPRRWLLYFVFAAITGILLFLASRIDLQQNVMQMLPQDKQTEEFTGFFENSKFSDRIMVAITPADTLMPGVTDSLVAFSDRFAGQLQQELSDYIASVEYTANDDNVNEVLQTVDAHFPLFLEEQDYRRIDSMLEPQAIKEKVAYNYRTLTGFAGIALKKFIVNDPMGFHFMAYNKLKNYQGDGQMGLYEQHFLSKDEHHLLLFINPQYPSANTLKNGEFFKKLDELNGRLAQQDPRFRIVYFGAPAVAAGNASQITRDNYLTVSITLVLLVLIVIIFFRRVTAPLIVMIPVAFGALFAIAMIYLLKGHISMISLGAGSLILGIAVNYSLHFLTHYRYHPDVREVIKDLSFPMTIGSLTTIGGFLCLQFVKAPVLRDLGLFAALSLVGAAIATLVFLPHFMRRNPAGEPQQSERFAKTEKYQRWLKNLQHSKYFALALLLLTPVFFYYARHVQFEDDMNKINYMSPQLKEAEKTLNAISSYYQKSIFVIAKGRSLDEALAAHERLLPTISRMQSAGSITSYTNVSTLLLSQEEQARRIARWKQYWTPEKRKAVLAVLNEEGAKLGFKSTAFAPFETITTTDFKPLSNEDEQVFRRAFLNNFIEEKNGTYTVIGLLKTTPDHVKEVYAELTPFPHITVFDRQYITDSLVRIVGDDFNFITLFSSLLVLLALFISYGRIELALITFIPMVVSWIWILGIMAIFGIKFNIINIILSTLVFALGDDYCIFTMDGLQQEYARGVKSLRSVTTSILLSVVTTIVGLGMLIFAKHPALNSIGFVSIIGILCVWIISQTLQPLLFNFLIKKPTSKHHAPYTFWNLLRSVFAFAYFVVGALLLNPIGLILTRLVPGKKKRSKYIYHWILSKFTWSLVAIMSNVKKKIINDVGEDFSKPAVVIANHQSFLDILAMVLSHPKLILLTNKWVWNSPVFGLAVRMADYVMAEDAEKSMDHLARCVEDGYSIVIFPEGTRSVDCTIKRFHKGAFYLAEKLNIDILPVVLHGTGYCMTKGEFLLKNGQMTTKFLPRISPGDPRYGNGYAERAKYIGRYFRQEYQRLCEELETPSYFKEQLISNFLFKGPFLEWYMKIKLKLERNYKVFNELLPKKGHILDLGCGYGFLSYMLGYTSNQRTVRGVDYDEHKIEIAQHGYLKGKHVSFEQCNALEYEFDQYDAIVISDMLHYLQPADQSTLLEKCIASLCAGGMLVIRDGIKELEARHQTTRLTEWFSTRFFRFNKTGANGLSFVSSQFIRDMAEKHALEVSMIDNTIFTSNVIFVLKKKG